MLVVSSGFRSSGLNALSDYLNHIVKTTEIKKIPQFFVRFQVLAKASKIIPVMLMGKLVSKNKYEYYEYVVAILISIGMTFFLMGATEEKNSKYTTHRLHA